MKIKIIDFGLPENHRPLRSHANDAGADVYMPVVCELPPVDSGYRGEIHAIVSNVGNEARTLPKDSRIGQLIIMPVVIADFVNDLGGERGKGAFGSTGK